MTFTVHMQLGRTLPQLRKEMEAATEAFRRADEKYRSNSSFGTWQCLEVAKDSLDRSVDAVKEGEQHRTGLENELAQVARNLDLAEVVHTSAKLIFEQNETSEADQALTRAAQLWSGAIALHADAIDALAHFVTDPPDVEHSDAAAYAESNAR